MLRLKFLFFLIIVGLLWLAGCNKTEPVCPDSQAYDFKLTLTHYNDSTSTKLKFYNANGSIVSEGDFPTLLSVPVDVNSDSTTFFIDFINDTLPTITDSIKFTYTRCVKLQHQECGFIMEFVINGGTYTKYQIDSVSFINDSINENNESNLEIFY